MIDPTVDPNELAYDYLNMNRYTCPKRFTRGDFVRIGRDVWGWPWQHHPPLATKDRIGIVVGSDRNKYRNHRKVPIYIVLFGAQKYEIETELLIAST